MQVGFTGTQKGMTDEQRRVVAGFLDELCPNGGHVHHGDCIGADAEFHQLARDRGLRVELHPPSDPKKRAFCDADIRWPEYSYMKRNKHIVDCSEVMIAAPGTAHEVQRSGTWATIREAGRQRKFTYVVNPDGSYHATMTASRL